MGEVAQPGAGFAAGPSAVCGAQVRDARAGSTEIFSICHPKNG